MTDGQFDRQTESHNQRFRLKRTQNRIRINSHYIESHEQEKRQTDRQTHRQPAPHHQPCRKLATTPSYFPSFTLIIIQVVCISSSLPLTTLSSPSHPSPQLPSLSSSYPRPFLPFTFLNLITIPFLDSSSPPLSPSLSSPLFFFFPSRRHFRNSNPLTPLTPS